MNDHIREEEAMHKEQQLLTTGEAAKQLQVSSETIRRWAAKGLIESYRLPSGQLRVTLRFKESSND